MKNTEINTTANACDKKYFTMLNNALSVMHTITGSLPFCSYDNAHSLTADDMKKHVFTFNVVKGTAKSVSFTLGDNPDLVDAAKYNDVTTAFAWYVVEEAVKSAAEKIEAAWKVIEDDNRENVEDEEYADLSRRIAIFRLRMTDFATLIKDVTSKDTNDKIIRLMVAHGMNNQKQRRAILEELDKHDNLSKLYGLEYIEKESQASSLVKEAVNNLFNDIMSVVSDESGIHKFRIKIDSEAKEAVTKACLHAFYEAGSASKKGYHGEVLTENTNKEAICAQVVYALRRAIQRRIVMENAVNG